MNSGADSFVDAGFVVSGCVDSGFWDFDTLVMEGYTSKIVTKKQSDLFRTKRNLYLILHTYIYWLITNKFCNL